MSTRFIALEGVLNFRDYGDYRTVASRHLRPGRLFRSAHHGRATDADLEQIAALDIGVVVDLRRPAERQREPSRRHAGFDGEVIESNVGSAYDDDALWSWVREGGGHKDELRDNMVAYYRRAPTDDRLVDLYSRYFEALARTDRAVLIHCAAGKDRTGLLAALTHHLVGVHRDDAIADYLLTNQVVDLEKRVPLMMQAIEQGGAKPISADVVRVVMGVDAAYLEAALDSIAADHGGVDGYLKDVLGVDEARRGQIEDRLLA